MLTQVYIVIMVSPGHNEMNKEYHDIRDLGGH